jgi:hypothetical protein
VQHFGKDPDRASRYIGPLGCTLGRVIERHDGAASSTDRDRNWPEVYFGTGLMVAIALKAMSESSRTLIWYHYVARCWNCDSWLPLKHPLKQRTIAERMGVSRFTVADVERGKPGTSIAASLGALWVLGLLDQLAEVADPDRDGEGKALEAARQPGQAPRRHRFDDDF